MLHLVARILSTSLITSCCLAIYNLTWIKILLEGRVLANFCNFGSWSLVELSWSDSAVFCAVVRSMHAGAVFLKAGTMDF